MKQPSPALISSLPLRPCQGLGNLPKPLQLTLPVQWMLHWGLTSAFFKWPPFAPLHYRERICMSKHVRLLLHILVAHKCSYVTFTFAGRLQLVETDPSQIPKLRNEVPNLCKMLRRLVQGSGVAPGLDISGVCNPFLQVKILRLLRHLGERAPPARPAVHCPLARPGDALPGSCRAQSGARAAKLKGLRANRGRPHWQVMDAAHLWLLPSHGLPSHGCRSLMAVTLPRGSPWPLILGDPASVSLRLVCKAAQVRWATAHVPRRL